MYIYLAILTAAVILLCVQCHRTRKKQTEMSLIRRRSTWLISIVPFLLVAIAVWRMQTEELGRAEQIWMCMSSMVLVVCVLLCMWQMLRTQAVLEYIEIGGFLFLNMSLMELTSGMAYQFANIKEGIWNILLFLTIYLLLCGILWSEKRAMVGLNALTVVLAATNHYIYIFRGKPFELSDLLMMETAKNVMGNYHFAIGKDLIYAFVLEIGIILFIILYQRRFKGRKEKQALMVFELLLLAGNIAHTPNVGHWDMANSTEWNGYLNSFVGYAKKDFSIQKPQHYALENVEAVLAEYTGKSASAHLEEKPNIIVIMNEAFADLPKTFEFETNVDGMPFIHSLTKNTIKGTMMSSVFGGSTSNTEFEFLTGNTMAFLTGGSVPYMQYIRSTQESLTQELKKYGYQALAFHPYERSGYNRENVYEHFGFHRFISIEDKMKYRDTIRNFQSDESDIKNVIDLYEQSDKKEPFYIFNVTMQNHGGYSEEKSEVEVTVYPVEEELQTVQINEYLSLIRETDRAFEQLVSYFEKEDKKTIILMFGDHQPGLDYTVLDAWMQKKNPEISALEMEQKKHEVPFILWANYDIGSEEGERTSPAYLRPLLLEKAGLPLGPYDRFLQECSKVYPAVNAFGYYDADGNVQEFTDQLAEDDFLYQWQILQYGNLFDKKHITNGWQAY